MIVFVLVGISQSAHIAQRKQASEERGVQQVVWNTTKYLSSKGEEFLENAAAALEDTANALWTDGEVDQQQQQQQGSQAQAQQQQEKQRQHNNKHTTTSSADNNNNLKNRPVSFLTRKHQHHKQQQQQQEQQQQEDQQQQEEETKAGAAEMEEDGLLDLFNRVKNKAKKVLGQSPENNHDNNKDPSDDNPTTILTPTKVLDVDEWSDSQEKDSTKEERESRDRVEVSGGGGAGSLPPLELIERPQAQTKEQQQATQSNEITRPDKLVKEVFSPKEIAEMTPRQLREALARSVVGASLSIDHIRVMPPVHIRHLFRNADVQKATKHLCKRSVGGEGNPDKQTDTAEKNMTDC